jgi:hypothetical protein
MLLHRFESATRTATGWDIKDVAAQSNETARNRVKRANKKHPSNPLPRWCHPAVTRQAQNVFVRTSQISLSPSP